MGTGARTVGTGTTVGTDVGTGARTVGTGGTRTVGTGGTRTVGTGGTCTLGTGGSCAHAGVVTAAAEQHNTRGHFRTPLSRGCGSRHTMRFKPERASIGKIH